MPKELKKRGRREEKKRKQQQAEDAENYEVDDHAKRQKLELASELPEASNLDWDEGDQGQDDYNERATQADGYEFYGLLGEDDQAYFKRADQMLELNQFADREERSLFLTNVWREAHGKELKIASSQSCSRFMERLIRMSYPAQLKALFRTFSGHFLSLVQHRFASHCCETLFLYCAPVVTEELIAPSDEVSGPGEGEDVFVSMENLFLFTVNEIADSMGFLMTDSFASHTLRVLLVVLSGKPIESNSTSSLLHSKNKEKIEFSGRDTKPSDAKASMRIVPSSFHEAIRKTTTSTLGGLDTNYLRALATQPLGNPVIQLLLEIEFITSGKPKAKDNGSLFRRLMPDDPLEEGTQSVAFLKGLLYDPVGSRLLETIIQHAPGKIFKSIYRILFRDNLGKIVRNEIAGFVIIKALERLSRDDLEHTVQQISPEIPMLLRSSRTSVVRMLIERCRVRNVDVGTIAESLKEVYGQPGDVSLLKMLSLDLANSDDTSDQRKPQKDAHSSGKLHSSFLVQTMLEAPDVLQEMIFTSLLQADPAILVSIAKDRTATHALQASFTCDAQSKIFRRKIVQQLVDHVTELALDPVGSHVVDALWNGTEDLHYLRERIAGALSLGEVELRDSYSGRAVWRNWMMDLYKRRKLEWLSRSKARDGTEAKSNSAQRSATVNEKPRSAIELARERYAISRTGRPGRGNRLVHRVQTSQTTLATMAR